MEFWKISNEMLRSGLPSNGRELFIQKFLQTVDKTAYMETVTYCMMDLHSDGDPVVPSYFLVSPKCKNGKQISISLCMEVEAIKGTPRHHGNGETILRLVGLGK